MNLANHFPNTIRKLATIGTILTATLSGISDIQAETKKKVDFAVCEEKKPLSSLLSQACKASITNPTLRMELLESLRSAPAFENAAAALKEKIDLSDRTFSALYPGGGAHIAPIVMAMKYIDEGTIDAATFTYTEIDENTLIQLEYLLKNIRSVTPSLEYHPNDKKSDTCDNAENGTITNLELTYKGKSIHIRFLLSCSGKKYFQATELEKSKVFISHDSSGGPDLSGNILMLEEYIREAKALETKKLPPIIMEDLTRRAEYANGGRYLRYLDLEFLGKVTRITGGFGHREMIEQPLKNLSPAEIHKLEEDLKKYAEYAGFTKEDLEEWKKNGVVPERSSGQKEPMQHAEVGYASHAGAVILEMNPAILSMNQEQRTLIFETQMLASGNKYSFNGGVGGDRNRLPPNRDKNLFSSDVLMQITSRIPEMLETVHTVNPMYEQVFAYRLAQAMMQLDNQIADVMREDTEKRKKLIPAARSLYQYLKPAQQSGLKALTARIQALYRHHALYGEYLRKNSEAFSTTAETLPEEQRHALFDANYAIEDKWKSLTEKPFEAPMQKSIRQLNTAAEKLLQR